MSVVRYLKKGVIRLLIVILIVILTLLAVRIYESEQGKSLSLWHTVELNELTAQQIDNATWDDYLLAEEQLFTQVKEKITDQLSPSERNVLNRYQANNPVNPNQFSINWNRSFILQPAGKVNGAVVLLHGLTDSPYTMRNLALHYQAHGFVVVCIRMPAHGTAPAALSTVQWQDWLAATRLAVRTATRYIDKGQPLHLVGYSNGGALAMMYTFDALTGDDLTENSLRSPEQLVLIAPMLGVTSFAKYSRLAALPAIFPQFANTRWIDIVEEYNPFKYNSFPINGARQSYLLTSALKERRITTDNKLLAKLPPILTFLSAVDSTINNQATLDFYSYFTNNKNELVIFDVNRFSNISPLLNETTDQAITDLLPALPRSYKTVIVTNNEMQQTVAESTEAGDTITNKIILPITYPNDIYSLSHIALPYPETDSLYGNKPTQLNEFGISLGTLNIRGERKALVTSLDNLLRVSYNPFYPFMLEQIDFTINKAVEDKP